MPVPPSATQWSQLKVVSSFPSPQKYTQHLLSGTPAFHDHAHVGVRSHAGATSNQSPCFCKGMSGVPLTRDITGGPFGATRTIVHAGFEFGAEHKKASEDAAGSKVDDRAVLGNESTRGSDLVEMSEHDRIHVGKHDPPRAQVRQPRLEHVPGDMAGQFAGIGEAFDHKEIGAGGDERVHHSVSPE